MRDERNKSALMTKIKNLKRRDFLKKSVGAAIITAGLSAMSTDCGQGQNSGTSSNRKQRNVLLLISDDQGIDQLGCYGNNVIQTPHMDWLAQEGVRFTNAFAIVASCSASRGTILTGLYPHQNGQYGHMHNWHHFSFHSWIKTLPEMLKENGFRTGVIGKLHVAPSHKLPFDFAISEEEVMSGRDVKTMADKAAGFLNQDPEKPFFLLVGYSDPHRMPHGWSHMRGIENYKANEKL